MDNDLFFTKVWRRMIAARLKSPQWQAENPVIPDAYKYNRTFYIDYMSRPLSESAAYDVFITDFARLSPEWQRRVSTRTLAEWNAMDYARRHPEP